MLESGAGAQPAHSRNDRKLLEAIYDNTQIMAVKLFGASRADDETPEGRLPKVEAKATRAHLRIDKVERKIIWASGFGAALGTIGGVLASHIFH